MKHMMGIAVTTVAMVGYVCAQQPVVTSLPAAGGTSGATNLSALSRPMPGASSAMRMDMAKMQQIAMDLKAIGVELQPMEDKIKAGDPLFKTLTDRQIAITNEYTMIEKQRATKLDALLSADPHTAALVSKRNELLQQRQALLQQMRAAYPMGGMNGMRSGMSMPPRTDAGAVRSATPAAVVAPAVTVPATDKADAPVAK